MRASVPRLSRSCMGVSANTATEAQTARINSQAKPECAASDGAHPKPIYRRAKSRSLSGADAYQPRAVSLSCVPV